MEAEVQRWEHNYASLSARHRALLHHLPAKAAAARRAVQQNQLFIRALLYNFAGVDDDSAAATAAGSTAEAGVAAEPQQQQQQQQQQHDDGIMPDDLYSGAVKAADALQAAGQKCPPGDAEKVQHLSWAGGEGGDRLLCPGLA
jgi:hypothetical protein